MFVFYSSHKIPPSNSLFPPKYKDSDVDTRHQGAAVGVRVSGKSSYQCSAEEDICQDGWEEDTDTETGDLDDSEILNESWAETEKYFTDCKYTVYCVYTCIQSPVPAHISMYPCRHRFPSKNCPVTRARPG